MFAIARSIAASTIQSAPVSYRFLHSTRCLAMPIKTHLPGYVTKADELKSKGISEIICLSVNDPFVMEAWGVAQNAKEKIKMLADPKAEFTKAVELEVDIAPLGGIRSKRYSMVVDNGTVESINVEPDGTGLSCSLADKIKV
ncbi:hypothetical protein B566_EDAN013876 [Ephemera danica]|nr:hypothetical protein B566_EDAN013876 [Ephemera danica]